MVEQIGQMFHDICLEVLARITLLPTKILYDVPYVSQYARTCDAERIIKKELAAIHDPYWQSSGAISPREYAEWTHTMCGIATASMAMQFFSNRVVKLVPLAKEALDAKVYDRKNGRISEMRYRPFATWIQKYGLRAEIHSRLSLRAIKYGLAAGKLPIVSVNPNIRGYQTSAIGSKGGHLVLVVGYDMNRRVLTLHNPSGFASLKTQIGHELSDEVFKMHYAGRGILMSNNR